jgi:membrane protein CcdC involved in cytochrome C biogenesis
VLQLGLSIVMIPFELVSGNSILLQNRLYGLFILLLQPHFTMRLNITITKLTLKKSKTVILILLQMLIVQGEIKL